MEWIIAARMRQTPTHIRGMVNEVIEATFTDALTFSLDDDVGKDEAFQSLIARLAPKAVNQGDELERLCRSLSETFLDND